MSSLKLRRWRKLGRWRNLGRSRNLGRWRTLGRWRKFGRWAVAGLALAVVGCASSGAGQAGPAGQAGVPGPSGPAEAAIQDVLRPPVFPLGTALYDMTWFEVPQELSGKAGFGWRLAFGGPRGSGTHIPRRCPLDQPIIFFEGKVFPCFSHIPALDELEPGMRVRMRIVRGRPAGIMFGTRAERGGVVMFVIWDPDRER